MDENIFGKRLKTLREHLRLSQDKLAEQLNTHQHTISNYEMGIRFPDVRFILKLSKITNVNINWLFGKSENMLTGIDSENKKIKELIYWMEKVPIIQYKILGFFEETKVNDEKYFRIEESENKGVSNEEISFRKNNDN